MLDMHCHLDFLNQEETRLVSDHLDHRFLTMTVDPQEFPKIQNRFKNATNVKVGIGLHPRWILDTQDASVNVKAVKQHMESTNLIGEVGLDYLPAYLPHKSEQYAAFKSIMHECVRHEGKVISIHAIRSVKDTLDILKTIGVCKNNLCILHWFTGSSDELHHAINLGCWFSVNRAMLETKKGREYIKVIPNNKLLLESDKPSSSKEKCTLNGIITNLEECKDAIERIKRNYSHEIVEENSQKIFAIC